jgi:hypothetical protein
MGDVAIRRVRERLGSEPTTVIALLGLLVKLVKWLVVAVAYVLVGLVKMVTIVVVLAFFTSRGAVRRLLDAKGRNDDDGGDEYDLGYPSGLGRSSERLTQDAFDARWQRERDLRVAERRVGRANHGDAVVTRSAGKRAVVAAGSDGLESSERGWTASERGAAVVRP